MNCKYFSLFIEFFFIVLEFSISRIKIIQKIFANSTKKRLNINPINVI
jgi:hypothetical protein